MSKEQGTKENPWKLKTPPLTSDYEMYKDIKDGKDVIVCVVGKTTLLYDTAVLPTFTLCSKSTVTGWNLAALTNKNLQKKARLKPGAVRRKIRWVAGTDLKKDFADVLECTFHH